MRWLWILVLAIVAVAVVLYQVGRTRAAGNSKTDNSGSKKSKKGGAGPIPVAVAKARRGDAPVYLNGLGNVVKEGQVLAQIDPRPFQVQLDTAECQMAKDTANLRNSRLDSAGLAETASGNAPSRGSLNRDNSKELAVGARRPWTTPSTPQPAHRS